jgi:hypothetical protein
MLEDGADRSDIQQELRTLISFGETLTYGELQDLVSDSSKINRLEVEMLYMESMECVLEFVTVCHDLSSNKIYLMCKSCAIMHHSLVSNVLDLKSLDGNCAFLDPKDIVSFLNMSADPQAEIFIAVHSHTNDMLFMLAPVTIVGPGVVRLKNGQCSSRHDVVSFWGEM